MRNEKGERRFFYFFVERQKVALATQVSTHRLTASPTHQLFCFKPIPISLNQLNQSIYRFFFGNVFFDAGLTFV